MMAEMFVITFANPKGGSGKTTAALLLTEQLARASDRVAILDCGPNRNIDMWAEERAERGQATPFATLSRPPAGKLPDLVRHSDFDFLVIDLEGTADALVVDALSVSDLCIVPFEPTPMEARQAGRAIAARGLDALVVDISARTAPEASELAQAMRARFLALPMADAAKLHAAVKATQPGALAA